ncbi:probable protein disulfide-isomerase A4 [Ornithodoros turicata]|uniref:probable protein disulfide-isomerase A4 n=1 Tax=Ornithodoros turicata TaxID=34597 RepID=UPI003139C143
MFIRSVIVCFFFQELISSSVLADPLVEAFDVAVRDAKRLLVIFTKECCDCEDCVEAEAIITAKTPELEDDFGISTFKVTSGVDLESRYGITSRPSLLFFRDKIPALYDGPIHPDHIMEWLHQSLEPGVKSLNDQTFEHLTQAATGATTGNWLVVFFRYSCPKGNILRPVLEGLSPKIKLQTNVATVDIETNPELVERFSIKDCPTVLFFRLGKMYKYESTKRDIKSLKHFTESLYRNMKAYSVPMPQSPFDKLTEAIADFAKEHRQVLLIGSTAALTAVYLSYKVLSLQKAKALKKE